MKKWRKSEAINYNLLIAISERPAIYIKKPPMTFATGGSLFEKGAVRLSSPDEHPTA